MYSSGTPETLTFAASASGVVNFLISGYDMMGGTGVSMSIAVNGTTIATSSSSTPTSGSTAISTGQTVVLTFVGSSMAYSSYDLWLT